MRFAKNIMLLVVFFIFIGCSAKNDTPNEIKTVKYDEYSLDSLEKSHLQLTTNFVKKIQTNLGKIRIQKKTFDQKGFDSVYNGLMK